MELQEIKKTGRRENISTYLTIAYFSEGNVINLYEPLDLYWFKSLKGKLFNADVACTILALEGKEL